MAFLAAVGAWLIPFPHSILDGVPQSACISVDFKKNMKESEYLTLSPSE